MAEICVVVGRRLAVKAKHRVSSMPWKARACWSECTSKA